MPMTVEYAKTMWDAVKDCEKKIAALDGEREGLKRQLDFASETFELIKTAYEKNINETAVNKEIKEFLEARLKESDKYDGSRN